MAEEGKKRPAGAEAEGTPQPPQKVLRREDQAERLQKTAEQIRQFGVDEVRDWVKAMLLKNPEIAETLYQQQVDGEALMDLTYQRLVDKPYNIAAGPAGNLAKRIAALSAPPTAASGFQDDPEATEFIRELANATPQGLREGVQVFDLKTSLPVEPYGQSGPRLLTRNTTRQAWQASFKLMSNGIKRVAMLGVPGIGKSRNLALGLWHLVTGKELPSEILQPEAIVFEARQSSKVFLFTKGQDGWKAQSQSMRTWDAAACPYLKDCNNWYLVDAFETRTPTFMLSAKTVLACSPDRDHYSNFVKDGGQCVFVEAFSWAELEACREWLKTQVDLEEMRGRFEQIGGALRTLLADKVIYEQAVKQQSAEAEDFTTVRRAFAGDLSTFEEKKMPTRLFTYLSANGISSQVTVCSPAVAKLILEKHYDKLVQLWSDASNPTSRYWLEEFVGPLLTTFWPGKEGLTVVKFTDEGLAKAKWIRTQGKDLEVKEGLQLLKCGTEQIFEKRWQEAVEQGGLKGHVLHSPENYTGIDYLVEFNHGIQVTNSDTHTIADAFCTKLPQMFPKSAAPRQNFTLTFLITGRPQNFSPHRDGFTQLMKMSGCLFDNVCVQVVQIPKTLNSLS